MATSRLARLRSKRTARALKAIAIALVAPWIALVITAVFLPLPKELADTASYDASIEIRDRNSTVIREIRADDGARARFCSIDALGPKVLRAAIAAEDRRFDHHPGVDPIAIVRALFQDVTSGRVVSGASTITQQLARNVVPRPRSLVGKFLEMALALRIEASLSKRAILEQYLNRVAFGPGLRGVEAASRFYFDKPPRDLSLAEAAALAGMPRGPSLYDPTKNKERVVRRRDRVLDRMLDAGLASPEDVASAKAEPLALAPHGSGLGAPHLVRAVLSGALERSTDADRLAGGGSLRERATSITLTIDRGLQRELEVLARGTVRELASSRVSAASVVVLDNASGDILAYVGSPDIEDAAKLGHNDGVLAARQPGSTLKPFVYELAMERLGFTAATALPDVDLHIPGASGDYHPQNYDGRYHGPVRLREALANSYNVPAVVAADALGADRVLQRLRELGFSTLDQDATTYGLALALGDGEVRLLDLANAYATLARGGMRRPVRAVLSARSQGDQPLTLARDARGAASEATRVLQAAETFVITDILADKNARLSSFGEGSALELPFPVAAKTGTSKGYRDNYAVGFTPDITVAVWVGNFDGSPMIGVSGIAGAGPLFQASMLAASRLRAPRPFERPADLIEEGSICALSGERPGPACPHARRELFVTAGLGDGSSATDAPGRRACDMHELVRIERSSGLRAGPGCTDAEVEERSFERYSASLLEWARSAGRPLAPEASSPGCPEARSSLRDDCGDATPPDARRCRSRGRLRVAYPPDGASFSLDPALAGPQAIRIRADVPSGAIAPRLVVDGRSIALREGSPWIDWPLAPGAHQVRVEAGSSPPSEEVEFTVHGP